MRKLPSGWEDKTLEECCEIVGQYGANASAIDYSERLPRYIRITDITDDGRLHATGVVSVNLDGNEKYILRDKDFLFARSGATVGKSYLYREADGWAIFAGYLIKFRTDERILLAEYLKQFTQSELYWTWIKTSLRAGAQPNVNATEYASLLIPLPPLAEQRKIAAILSTWDAAITLTRQLIAALQQRKQALMQLLLTGAVRFPEFNGVWEQIQVKELGKITSGGTPDTTNPAYWNGDILWCTPTEITALLTKYISETGRQITAEGLKNSSAVLLEPNSILICTRATVGQMGINLVPMATNQGFKNLTPSDAHNPEFLYYLLSLNKHELVRLANGSTFLELSKGDFEEMRFTIPVKPEQRRIADVLDACDQTTEMYQRYTETLNVQKRGLMQQLLTGAVRVRADS